MSNGSIPKAKSGRGFDRLSGLYDRMAALFFGKSLKNAQLDGLVHLGLGGRILILGGGTGWYLRALLLNCDPQKVVCLDISEKMLFKSRDAIADLPESLKERVFFVQGGLEKLADLPHFDVVVTHFFLDLWQESLPEVCEQLDALLESGGKWSLVDFFVPRGFFRSLRARVLIWTMYRFFRLCCKIEARKLGDFDSELVKRGYRLNESWFRSGKMIKGAVWKKPKKGAGPAKGI